VVVIRRPSVRLAALLLVPRLGVAVGPIRAWREAVLAGTAGARMEWERIGRRCDRKP